VKVWWSQFKCFLRGKPLVHCWAEGPCVYEDYERSIGSMCLRLDGHLGGHDFIPDNEVTVRVQ